MKIPELELDLQKSSLSLELSLNSIKNIREHELGKIAELEKKKTNELERGPANFTKLELEFD